MALVPLYRDECITAGYAALLFFHWLAEGALARLKTA
jgi:hypothetical protein